MIIDIEEQNIDLQEQNIDVKRQNIDDQLLRIDLQEQNIDAELFCIDVQEQIIDQKLFRIDHQKQNIDEQPLIIDARPRYRGPRRGKNSEAGYQTSDFRTGPWMLRSEFRVLRSGFRPLCLCASVLKSGGSALVEALT